MYLKQKQSGDLIKVEDVTPLIDPMQAEVPGQLQGGQEEQPTESFSKSDLVFPSGESLPRCWLDADYQDAREP